MARPSMSRYRKDPPDLKARPVQQDPSGRQVRRVLPVLWVPLDPPAKPGKQDPLAPLVNAESQVPLARKVLRDRQDLRVMSKVLLLDRTAVMPDALSPETADSWPVQVALVGQDSYSELVRNQTSRVALPDALSRVKVHLEHVSETVVAQDFCRVCHRNQRWHAATAGVSSPAAAR